MHVVIPLRAAIGGDHEPAAETILKPDEIKKLDAFFKRTFKNPQMQVKARPRKDDSAEVYVGDEFLGIVFKDEDDGDYNFSMAILDIDLN
jgi:hypothetical protein